MRGVVFFSLRLSLVARAHSNGRHKLIYARTHAHTFTTSLSLPLAFAGTELSLALHGARSPLAGRVAPCRVSSNAVQCAFAPRVRVENQYTCAAEQTFLLSTISTGTVTAPPFLPTATAIWPGDRQLPCPSYVQNAHNPDGSSRKCRAAAAPLATPPPVKCAIMCA